MTFSRLLLVSVILLVLSSCAATRESMRLARVAEEFDTTYKGYARMIRWHEIDKSTLFYVDEPLRDEFQKRLDAIDQVKVVDYRIKDRECWPKKGMAEITMEWDYYIPPSVTVKTMKDPQKWRYIDEENRKGWLLTTLLPEFKK